MADKDIQRFEIDNRAGDARLRGTRPMHIDCGMKMLVELTRLRENYSFMSMEQPKVQRYLNFRKQPRYMPDQRVGEH